MGSDESRPKKNFSVDKDCFWILLTVEIAMYIMKMKEYSVRKIRFMTGAGYADVATVKEIVMDDIRFYKVS
ncbi:hypothetical protein ABEY61_29305 [Bacillus toyonensis]|uniref:hypothetical protein n=1 Tax=Bacillus toyonensis TaxID=155322 RepID=UPI003D1DA022